MQSSNRHEINIQSLDLLVTATAKITTIFPITATVLVIVLMQQMHPKLLFMWLSVVLLCSVLRHLVHRRYHARDKTSTDYDYWLKHLLVVDICTGLTVGSSAAFIAFLPDLYDILVFVVMIAISMESVGVQSTVKSSFSCFIFSLFAALIPSLLLFEGPLNYAFIILSLFHLVLIWANFKSLNSTMINSLELALTNQQLNEQLKETNLQLETSHNRVKLANSAQSRFIADMSHELRTPMQGLLGSISLALKSTKDNKLLDTLNTAKTSGTTLLNLLNGILDLSRAEKGQLKANFKPFNLSELCKELCSLMTVTAQSKGLRIQYEEAHDIPEIVIFDKDRLSQIILNFLSNAIKFNEKEEVKFELKRLPDKPNGFQICVSDEGPGIMDDDLQTIFLPYHQLQLGKNRGGAGLGLAICKELSELIGAKISVQSEIGVGSTFSLSFSAKMDKPIEKQEVQEIEDYDFDDIKVLIAEDEPLSRKVLQAFFDSMGIEVFLAKNGREAIDICQTQKFDLVLMDCQMPELDGFSAAKHIRQHCLLNSKSVIIAMSAHIETKDEETAKKAGMNKLISKPIAQDTLVQVVASL